MKAAPLVMALAGICSVQLTWAQTVTGSGDVTPIIPAAPLPSWAVGGNLYVGHLGTGTLDIFGGGTVHDDNAFLGFGVGSNGTATVSGSGSTWTNVFELYVGKSGTGTLNIKDAGSVISQSSWVGLDTTSNGIVNVSGNNAILNTVDSTIGYQGSGTLNVTEGASVISKNNWLGSLANSVGVVSVAGNNSTWNAEYIIIGNQGTGTLNIKEGGTVTNAVASLGVMSEGIGTVTVSGIGSVWTNRLQLTVGTNGTGTLNIKDGGTVTSILASLGVNPEGIGTVTVSGTGSTWANSSRLFVGNSGASTLNIADAGKVVVGSGAVVTTLASATGSTGSINIGAASVLPGDATGAGMIETAGIEFGSGTASLNFNHTDSNYEFATPLRSSGPGTHRLNHYAGTTRLTGDNSGFSGVTSVVGGRLIVANTLGGTLTVADGATLLGTGRVGTTTLQRGATIAPGNSIGTLAVAGDLTFLPGSVYRVEADPNSAASDRIVVTGTATLAGSAVHVGPEGGFASTRQYTILTANEVQGQFDSVSSNYAYLNPTLNYGVKDVTLRLTRRGSFAGAARTGNQRATANGLDSLAAGNPLHEFILTLPQDAPPAVLDNLSGEVHASVASSLIGAGATVRTLPLAHLRANLGAGMRPGALLAQAGGALPASALPRSNAQPAWAEVVGNWQTLDGNDNAAQVKQHTGGLFVGADHAVGGGWRVGAALGYTDGKIRIDDRNSKADVSSYSVALYGGKSFDVGAGKVNVLGGTSYTWHDIDSERYANVAGTSQKLTADYGANTSQIFTELGYAMALSDRAGIEPFAGLAWSDMRTRGFSESGGSAALSGQRSSDKQTSSTLGVRAQTGFSLVQSEGKLRATLGWRHAFGEVMPQSTMAFNGGQAFTVAGASIARNVAVAELGADLAVARNVTVGLNYSGQYGGGNREHGGSFNVRWRY